GRALPPTGGCRPARGAVPGGPPRAPRTAMVPRFLTAGPRRRRMARGQRAIAQPLQPRWRQTFLCALLRGQRIALRAHLPRGLPRPPVRRRPWRSPPRGYLSRRVAARITRSQRRLTWVYSREESP